VDPYDLVALFAVLAFGAVSFQVGLAEVGSPGLMEGGWFNLMALEVFCTRSHGGKSEIDLTASGEAMAFRRMRVRGRISEVSSICSRIMSVN
jgi:hypothetical protein